MTSDQRRPLVSPEAKGWRRVPDHGSLKCPVSSVSLCEPGELDASSSLAMETLDDSSDGFSPTLSISFCNI